MPTTIDRTGAQHVLAVLDEGIRDLQLLAAIPPSVPSTCAAASHDEDKMLARLSEEGLQRLVSLLRTQWQGERGLATLEGNQAFAASRTHQRRLLQQATRQSLVELRKTAGAHEDLMARAALFDAFVPPLDSSSSAAQAVLLEQLGELKAVLAQRFRSTLQQDLHASAVLATMTERQQLAEAALGSLSAAYGANLAGTAREVAALEELRARLEGELGEATARMEAEVKAIEAEADGSIAEIETAHEARKAALHQEIAALLPEMNRRAEEDAAEEAALKAQQARAEAELAVLLETYQQAAAEKQAVLESLRAAAAVEGQELAELREHFAIVALRQEERRQLEEARRAAAEAKRAEEVAANMRRLRSVMRIQAVYRGFRARKAYRSAKSGEAAGGEGKGKGKGGKKGAAGGKKGSGKDGGEKKKGGGDDKGKAPVKKK